jgi:hypothetical protein
MGINREDLEAELAELESLFPTQGNSPELIRQEIPASPNRAKLEAELAELENLYPSKTGFAHRAGQLLRGTLSGIGSEADVQSDFYNSYGDNPSLDFGDPLDRPGFSGFLTKTLKTEPEKLEINAADKIPELLGYGKEYEPEKEDTLGQVLNFGGKMIAPTPLMPMGGYGNVINSLTKGGIKAGSKALAKDLGMMGTQAAAIKGTPRFTEEGGFPGAIEDILKGAGTSAGLSSAGRTGVKTLNPSEKSLSRIEKSVSDYLVEKVGAENVDQVLDNIRGYKSSIGYKPLTSEIAENDSLAQLYRAQKGIAGSGIDEQQALNANAIKSALEGSKKGSDDILQTQDYVRGRTSNLESDVSKQVDEIRPKANVTDTGRVLQDTLIKGLKDKEQARRLATAPIYQSLENDFSQLNPTNALEVLNNTIVKGDVKADFDYIKKQMIPKPSGSKKQSMPTVAELSAVRKNVINSMLEKYERSGEKTRATMVKKVKNALDEDFKNIPQQRFADSLFNKLSGPVSEITENKALRSVTKERYGKPLMSESRVPGTFINSSSGSIDDSRALFNQIKDKPEAIQAVKDHLHEKAITSIVDPQTGKVDLKKLESFKDKYPGAKILYPDLYNVKLKNLSHAQFAANKFMDKTRSVQKTLERDAFGELVGGDPKNIMPEIFNKNSDRNMKNLISEVAQDKSQKSMNGLRNEAIDYFEKSISNSSKVGKNHVLSYDKMKKFMDNHQKALDEVLEPNQMSVIKEVEKIVGGQNSAATRGLAPGSPTNANIRNALSLSNWSTGAIKAGLTKLGVSIPGISEFIKNFADARLAQREAVLNRALRDTEYADFLMSTPLKSKADAVEFSKKMKQFNNTRYLTPELMELVQKEKQTE